MAEVVLLVVLLSLAGCVATSWAGVPSKLPPDKERGEALYKTNCSMCHGATAQGDGALSGALQKPAPRLAGNIRTDEQDGNIDLIQQGRGDMPAYSAIMDRHDTRRVLVWLGSLDEAGQPRDAKNKAEDEPAEPVVGGEGGQ
jgi:mono/diheme cytochrome c family protein